MGGDEAAAQAAAEPALGYHPCSTGLLTGGRGAGRGTTPGGEFDWGGRLRKGIGGAQRSAQDGREPSAERKGISGPDCDTDGWGRQETGT